MILGAVSSCFRAVEESAMIDHTFNIILGILFSDNLVSMKREYMYSWCFSVLIYKSIQQYEFWRTTHVSNSLYAHSTGVMKSSEVKLPACPSLCLALPRFSITIDSCSSLKSSLVLRHIGRLEKRLLHGFFIADEASNGLVVSELGELKEHCVVDGGLGLLIGLPYISSRDHRIGLYTHVKQEFLLHALLGLVLQENVTCGVDNQNLAIVRYNAPLRAYRARRELGLDWGAVDWSADARATSSLRDWGLFAFAILLFHHALLAAIHGLHVVPFFL
jgi:hypothetical protein